uniref:Uncharacterized protein n=1 Tax=Oryza brachyantha TaxID=4533 RepID=J3M357_ORYBR
MAAVRARARGSQRWRVPASAAAEAASRRGLRRRRGGEGREGNEERAGGEKNLDSPARPRSTYLSRVDDADSRIEDGTDELLGML